MKKMKEKQMNDQLEKLKKQLKREEEKSTEKQPEKKSAQSAKAENASTGKSKSAAGTGIEAERDEILGRGKKFIAPLALNPQKTLKLTVFIMAGLVAVFLLVISVMIYRFQSDSDLVYRTSQIIPFPAACINGSGQIIPYPSLCAGGSLIRYNEYLFELQTEKQYAQNPATGQEIDFDSEAGQQQLEQLQTLALNEAQRKLFIRQVAEERGVEVSDEEVQATVEEFVENEGGEEQFQESLEDFYGWSMSDFESVVSIQLLQREIVRQRALDVLEEVRAEEQSFAELAREHSGDGSAEEGGDIGFVTEDSDFVAEFEAAALELEVGEVSDLVETQFGFHILTATEEDEDDGIRISHILIDPRFLQQEVDERTEAARAQQHSFIGISFEPEAADPQQVQPEPESIEDDATPQE